MYKIISLLFISTLSISSSIQVNGKGDGKFSRSCLGCTDTSSVVSNAFENPASGKGDFHGNSAIDSNGINPVQTNSRILDFAGLGLTDEYSFLSTLLLNPVAFNEAFSLDKSVTVMIASYLEALRNALMALHQPQSLVYDVDQIISYLENYYKMIT